MIGLLRSMRVFVCAQPADMRRSFDGLCGMAEQLMKQDPLTGHLFVFRTMHHDLANETLITIKQVRDDLAVRVSLPTQSQRPAANESGGKPLSKLKLSWIDRAFNVT